MTDLPEYENAIFTTDDPRATVIGGMAIPDVWWSRGYEYAFARSHIRGAKVVADMGAGWMGRPFTAELAEHCEKVYAVDLDKRLLDLPAIERVEWVVGDFANEYLRIPAHSLDAVFCISVLEDLPEDAQERAWWEWRRLLKPHGRVIFTCDVAWDADKPCTPYPGTNVLKLLTGAYGAGFTTGDVSLAFGDNTVRNEQFNLCCFHGVAVLNE